ncbi:MAG: type II secretion system GspH family protein [Planctomycetales bacterium]|nr:type II secretion system GspH family protein [Planctomycetales bacterium]
MTHSRHKNAFTLVETLVVLMLAALILTSVLGIYQQVRGAAVTILERMEEDRLQTEILQKIAEDIDRLAAPGFDAVITFGTKLDNGYRSAQLTLENSYYGNNDKKETYERIVWQTSYDPIGKTLILYRMHDGLNVEDKVLETDAESSASAGLYIPVSDGVTFFDIQALEGENTADRWQSETLPKAVRVGISFALPRELPDGSIGVPEEELFYRTIAIDRTRAIPYEFIKKKFDLPEEQDPNDLLNENDPNAPADAADKESNGKNG